jgi:hypothetical protein
MHPHEATLRGLFKRVLIGETRAIKEFLEVCNRAGLIAPAIATSRSVIEAPEDVPLELASYQRGWSAAVARGNHRRL